MSTVKEEIVGVIYAIKSANTDRVYIGSTSRDDLKRRLESHEGSWRAWQGGKGSYYTSFEIFKDGDHSIENMETVKTGGKAALLQREQYYFTLFGSRAVNARNAHTSKAERREQHRKSYEKRKEKYNATITCDVCGTSVARQHKTRHDKTKKHIANLDK